MIGRGGGGALDHSSLVAAGAQLAIFGVVELARLSDRGKGLRLEYVVGDLAGGQRLGLDVLALLVVLGLPFSQRLADGRGPAQVVEEGVVEVPRLDLLCARCAAPRVLARAPLAVVERTRARPRLTDLLAVRRSLKHLSGGPLATGRHVCRHLVCLPAIRSMATHVGSRRTGQLSCRGTYGPTLRCSGLFFCKLDADRAWQTRRHVTYR